LISGSGINHPGSATLDLFYDLKFRQDSCFHALKIVQIRITGLHNICQINPNLYYFKTITRASNRE
jgi:hypothetical protein